MTDQVHVVAVSPAQRFALVNLAHAEGQKVKGQRARFFRRFLRAFGLTPILDAADEHKGRLSGSLILSRKPALFTVTAENVDYALELLEIEHDPAVERTLGSLWDVLEEAKAGRQPVAATAGELLGGAVVPLYDPAAESWAPDKAEKPIPEQIADYLRAQGHPEAATLVDRGGWDKPAPAPATNGQAAPQPEDRPEA